jgi:hypothetical protein
MPADPDSNVIPQQETYLGVARFKNDQNVTNFVVNPDNALKHEMLRL